MATITTRKTYRADTTLDEALIFARGYAAGVLGAYYEDFQQTVNLPLVIEPFYLVGGKVVWDIRLDLIDDAVDAWNRS